jgi:hypothetical protein
MLLKATHDPSVEIIAYNSEALIVIKANERHKSIYTVLYLSNILQKMSTKLTKVLNHNYPNKLMFIF